MQPEPIEFLGCQRSRVSKQLQHELSVATGLEVDLVRLDLANPLVKHEVARHGALLIERVPGAFGRFSANAALEYLDLLPLFEAQSQALSGSNRHGAQVTDPTLATSLGSAARLRNRVAHGYATLDVERLWNELPQGLAAFEQFASALANWLAQW